jgi:5-formyltetrahydrofolate cyclo-ligase
MPAAQKKLLRIRMKERRSLLFHDNPDAGERIADLFFEHFSSSLSSHTIVGGYWPIGSELDIRPLLTHLVERDIVCALPCVTSEGLDFHAWTPLAELERGTFGLMEPSATLPPLIPNIMLVPLLAFDKRGHRLGYGQGHFDRYLHQHSVLAIGIGFKDQEIDHIPHQSHDFALDYILTEQELVKGEA